MTGPLLDGGTGLAETFEALRADLLAEGGPRISTMRNYRFAILPYAPREEFALRRQVRRLSDELRQAGWNVLSISLGALLIERLRAEDPTVLARYIESERRLHGRDPARALANLESRVGRYVEGTDGIARDVIARIDAFANANPDAADRTIIWLGRAGALYPFFRSSALLKHLDGRTRNLPVVLLYPGERRDQTALSFMNELVPDRDYRPRIYGPIEVASQ